MAEGRSPSDLRALFERLEESVAALREERVSAVAVWRWATHSASLHRPEPFYGEIEGQSPGVFLDVPATKDWPIPYRPTESGGLHVTQYGFDREDRFVVGRSMWRHNVGEQLLWVEGDSDFVAELTHRGELWNVTVVDRDAAGVTGAVTINRWSCAYSLCVYDGDRIGEVATIDVNEFDGSTSWRLARLEYQPHGGLAFVHVAYGELAGAAPGAAPRERDWDYVIRGGHPAGETVWDWRLQQEEPRVPLAVALGGLESTIAHAVVDAAGEAVTSGAVEEPCFALVSLAGDSLFPPRGTLVDEQHHRRVDELQLGFDAAVNTAGAAARFGQGAKLPIFERFDDSTLRKMRQANQATSHDRTPLWTHEVGEVRAFLARLLVELDSTTWPRPGAHFLPFVASGSDPPVEFAREVLGSERVDDFAGAFAPAAEARRVAVRRPRTKEDIARLATRFRLNDAEAIASAARWAIGLVPDADASARSWFGGRAQLGPGQSWPQRDGQALTHVAHIELDEIQPTEGREILPGQGVLSLFMPEPVATGAAEEWGEDDEVGLLVWSEDVGPETPLPTHAAELPRWPIRFDPRLTLPTEPPFQADHFSARIYSDMASRIHWAAERHDGPHQMLGYFGELDDGTVWETEVLIARIGTDDRLGLSIFDAGDIHFLMEAAALQRGDWDSVAVRVTSS